LIRRLAIPAVLLAGLLAAACAVHVPPPAVPAGVSAAGGDSWARVLERHVDDRGRIDFAGVARERADLDAVVARIAEGGPRSDPGAFPTAEARLAWYLNAYNALAMYGVVRAAIPQELGSQKVEFFYRNRYRVGGEWLSLSALENDFIRSAGDPRVHFALNRMVRGSPRLPREPFDAARLDAQLDAAARLFVGDDRNVHLDRAAQSVRLSEMFHWYSADFLAKAPSLIAYVNGYRADAIPADSRLEFAGFDWTVNRQ